MRFWLKICAFFFVVGIFSLILVSADHVFGLGIWNGHYPPSTTEEGVTTYSSYGKCMLYLGITVVVAGALGTFLMGRIRRREVEALILLEAIRQQGIEEGRDEQ